MNILFLIRTLNNGGAERQLVNLAKGLKTRGHTVSVAVFYGQGDFQSDLEVAGVSVFSLEKKSRWDIFNFLFSLHKIVNVVKPDILHSYGSVPNCVGIVSRFLHFRLKIVWGVRASYLDLSQYGYIAKLVYKLECFLSRFASLIIINSTAGCEYAILNGFYESKIRVIHNGIDTEVFKPDLEARKKLREEWGLINETFLIGFVARVDVMKDHTTFIRAIAKAVIQKGNIVAVCIGGGLNDDIERLKKEADTLGIQNNVIWEQGRDDINACMNAFDVFVSSSYGEGFPNVIGEAMASGLPCVVTDVGDSAYLVGDCGVVTKPRDAQGLASAILTMCASLSQESKYLKHCSRKRIVDSFGFDTLIDNSEKCLSKLS